MYPPRLSGVEGFPIRPQGTRPPNIWYGVPQFWWFRLDEAQFCEKIKPELRTKLMPSELTRFWLLAEEILALWSISESKLEYFIRDKALPAYILNSTQGIVRLMEKDFRARTSGFFSGPGSIDVSMFKRSDLTAFEKSHPSVRKKRKEQSPRERDTQLIVNKGKELHQKYPDLDMKDMPEKIQKALKTKLYYHYEDSTILARLRKGVYPERQGTQGGRPKKTKRHSTTGDSVN